MGRVKNKKLIKQRTVKSKRMDGSKNCMKGIRKRNCLINQYLRCYVTFPKVAHQTIRNRYQF